jgi:hypothetical protein
MLKFWIKSTISLIIIGMIIIVISFVSVLGELALNTYKFIKGITYGHHKRL